MSNHFSHYFKELFLCCRFINLMNAQVHSTSIAADYKEELLKNYFPKIQYFILYVYTIVHVLWKKNLQGCHGILTVTNAFLRSTRGVKLHSYGLLQAINGGLAESPWRAKIFTLHTLCAQSVYRVYKKFMWHSDIRKDSERSPAKRSRLITASILQLCALLERANVAIYLALDAAFDTLITRSHSTNTTPFRFYCVLSKRRVAMRTLCMLKVCVVAWRSMRLCCDKSRCRCGVAPK